MRLSLSTLDQLKPAVRRPAYNPAQVSLGVVHFGPGAFHRAHQAPVFDGLLESDPGWGVCGVSLRHPDVANALGPQNGLYGLVEIGAETRWRVIGALREVLVAPDPAVWTRLDTAHLVTLTVTEKGYCLTAAGDLDLAHPDIRADLSSPTSPRSVLGWLVEGLSRRKSAGAAPFVAVSCDNLADNGGKLKRAVVALARSRDAELADWIEAEAAFPSSMVDSITPATDDTLRTAALTALGLEDAWPIQREPFTQWVIEDHPALRPLAAAGVTLTGDVRGYEQAKLRLLNAAHSTLAYAGLLRGHETVADAMGDDALAELVETLMRRDLKPSVEAPEGLDPDRYIDDVLARFRNPAIRHRLSQIAWDGSAKLQQRLMGAVEAAIRARRPVQRLALPFAAWMRFVRAQLRRGKEVVDPLLDDLRVINRALTDEPEDIDRFLDLDIFPPLLARHAAFREAVAAAYVRLPELPA